MTPSDWKHAPVRELLAGITTGVSVNSESRPRQPGELGVLKTSAVTYGVFRPDENKVVVGDELHRVRERPKAGCVLISRMNTPNLVGASAYVDRDWSDLVLPDRIWQLQPKPDATDGRWLAHFLSAGNIRRSLSELASGTSGSMKNLSQEKFMGLRVVVPPLGEQRKIATILSAVDEAIEATQAVIDQLQVVKKAMMAELFTRGLPGRHTRFKKTEIGDVPEEWQVLRAEAIFAEGPSNGRSPPSKASPPGVPTFSISAVRGGRVNISENVKYADGEPESLRGSRVRRLDILIVRGNGNPELVGKCGVVVEEPPPSCIYPDTLMRVRPTEALLPAFFVPLWNSKVIHGQILDKAKTTNGTYKINGQDVRDIFVPVPAKEEQQLIGQTLLSLETSILANAEDLGALRQLKNALMSVLLTGELHVHPHEEAT